MTVLLGTAHVFWETLKHRKKIFFATWFSLFSLFVFGIQKIPKKFQSSALFNFHSDFSKIPASSEFYSEMYDPNEIRAEKEAILLGVLSDDFLVELAEKYIGKLEADQQWVVQGLRKDIRFVPLSRTTYQLVVVQRSAEIVEKIAWEVLERLQESLRNDRLARMQSVYDSISQQLQVMRIDGQDEDLTLHMQAAKLRVENEIQKLESLYTAEHPRLIRLRAQLQNLRTVRQQSIGGPLEKGQFENWISLRGLLLTRQALLQVAIRMEEKDTVSHIKIVKEPDRPLWPSEPKKNLLLVSAFVTTTVVATGISACCSLVKDLRSLYPQLFATWKRYRRMIVERRGNPNTDQDV